VRKDIEYFNFKNSNMEGPIEVLLPSGKIVFDE
jgi:hypothetical protein